MIKFAILGAMGTLGLVVLPTAASAKSCYQLQQLCWTMRSEDRKSVV